MDKTQPLSHKEPNVWIASVDSIERVSLSRSSTPTLIPAAAFRAGSIRIIGNKGAASGSKRMAVNCTMAATAIRWTAIYRDAVPELPKRTGRVRFPLAPSALMSGISFISSIAATHVLIGME